MSDLVEFLRARLDEDERTAQAARGRDVTVELPRFMVAHMVRWDPARVLAEVEAKRGIVDMHSGSIGHECVIAEAGAMSLGFWDDEEQPCPTLRLLALPYADHPDYDEAWRP